MSDKYTYFNSLAEVTVVEKDGQELYSCKIVNKPRVGQPKGPAADPRAGQEFLAQCDLPVKPVTGIWKVNFSHNNETGVYEMRELTPTNVRAQVRFLGLPDVERMMGKGEKPVAVREPKTPGKSRYIIAKIELDSGPWKGLTATVFLNVEVQDLTTSSWGKLTRDFLRHGLGLPATANLVKHLSELRGIDGENGVEWVKVHEELLQQSAKVARGEAKPVRVVLDNIGAVKELYVED